MKTMQVKNEILVVLHFCLMYSNNTNLVRNLCSTVAHLLHPQDLKTVWLISKNQP